MSTTPRKRTPAKKSAATSTAAREAEASDGFVIIEQCGLKLKLPILGKVPLDAYIALKNGDELKGTELLMGPDQWAAFLEKKPTVGDFAAIGDKLQELAGN